MSLPRKGPSFGSCGRSEHRLALSRLTLSNRRTTMEISAKLVKELRERTGAGMMECKSALVEAKGNLAEAEIILRKRGIPRPARSPRGSPSRALSELIFTPARNWACWWR